MLRSLELRDYVIVERATLSLRAGFTVLTGETGAGKSILIDALGLALGERADARMVREGAARADICAEFASTPAFDQHLAALDLAGDPGLLLLRRIVEADGRSRALVNGHPTTVAQLKSIGASLVDIHGQHESQRLLGAAAQRQLIDRHGRLQPQVAQVAAAFEHWQERLRALEAARSGSRELQIRIDRLAADVAEIDALQLAADEWMALCEEQGRLGHASELASTAAQAAARLARGEDTLSDALRSLLTSLRPLAAIDSRLNEGLELLESAQIQVDEAASSLAAYCDRIELDPARLAQLEARLTAIHSTARRLRLAPESLTSHLEQARRELEACSANTDIEQLEQQVKASQARFDELAAALSEARRKVAVGFGRDVSKLLNKLAMAKARLVVSLTPTTPSASGIDAVEFGIAAHASGALRPIARFASGGELSRIGLAIATLSAADQPVPTLIFDEADAGIGGTVANVIGELMQQLGADRQVLCVTHLPQVASRADHHLLVAKEADAAATQVPRGRIDLLSPAGRIDEIARMLGAGKTSKAHAREMLTLAERHPPATAR